MEQVRAKRNEDLGSSELDHARAMSTWLRRLEWNKSDETTALLNKLATDVRNIKLKKCCHLIGISAQRTPGPFLRGREAGQQTFSLFEPEFPITLTRATNNYTKTHWARIGMHQPKVGSNKVNALIVYAFPGKGWVWVCTLFEPTKKADGHFPIFMLKQKRSQ